MRVMGIEEARAIVRWLDPVPLARSVWRAAGNEGHAVAALGLASRSVMIISWPAGGEPSVSDEPLVVLMVCDPGQHMRTYSWLSLGAVVPPSEEVVEAEVVEEVRGNEEYYERVEEQLQKIYGNNQAA